MDDDLAEWREAWANIQADYRNGVITRHQFLKEQEYMRQGRAQIDRSAATNPDTQ